MIELREGNLAHHMCLDATRLEIDEGIGSPVLWASIVNLRCWAYAYIEGVGYFIFRPSERKNPLARFDMTDRRFKSLKL